MSVLHNKVKRLEKQLPAHLSKKEVSRQDVEAFYDALPEFVTSRISRGIVDILYDDIEKGENPYLIGLVSPAESVQRLIHVMVKEAGKGMGVIPSEDRHFTLLRHT